MGEKNMSFKNFDEFYDKWCENPENTATRAFIEFSPSEVKSTYDIMKEAWEAAEKMYKNQ